MECVLNEVCEELRQELAVAIDLHAVRDLSPKRPPAILSDWSVSLGDRSDNIGEIHGLERRAPNPGFDLCDAQQCRKGVEEAICLLYGAIDHALVIGRRQVPV